MNCYFSFFCSDTRRRKWLHICAHSHMEALQCKCHPLLCWQLEQLRAQCLAQKWLIYGYNEMLHSLLLKYAENRHVCLMTANLKGQFIQVTKNRSVHPSDKKLCATYPQRYPRDCPHQKVNK